MIWIDQILSSSKSKNTKIAKIDGKFWSDPFEIENLWSKLDLRKLKYFMIQVDLRPSLKVSSMRKYEENEVISQF